MLIQLAKLTPALMIIVALALFVHTLMSQNFTEILETLNAAGIARSQNS